MPVQPKLPTGLHLFRPPYFTYERVEPTFGPAAGPQPGAAVVWFMAAVGAVWSELDWVMEKPRELPLFVVLPEPEDIAPVVPVLRHVPELRPRGVLPTAGRGTMTALRTLLATPPQSLALAVADYLDLVGLLAAADVRARVYTIFSRAPQVHSIEQMADELCQSRRTLGRFFRDRELPVPSHWLQFARLLHASMHLQNTRSNINRVAGRFGYPDGFTMSNSMNRLIGYRPLFVRDHLGWEWIVEEWLRREGLV